MKNIYNGFDDSVKKEAEEILFTADNARLVRIKSVGHTSPEGFWYEQEEDEWVMVAGGVGEIEWSGGEKVRLEAGDCLFIPAFKKHRVSYTSDDPPCIWLAVYGKINREGIK